MEKDGGRGKDQMGRGGTKPGRACIKEREKKKSVIEKGNKRRVRSSRGNVGVVSDSSFERGLLYKAQIIWKEARKGRLKKIKVTKENTTRLLSETKRVRVG